MSNWTLTNIPDQSGKIVLITGANSGIGLGVAKELANKGAHLILAVRNREKGHQARKEILAHISTHSHIDTQEIKIEVMDLDLSDFDSILKFCQSFYSRFDALDILINNAGIMMPNEKMESAQGHEIQFATNHLGHFLLTKQLLPALEKAPAGRIVTTSSVVAKLKAADIYFSDIHFNHTYHKMKSYAQSKLANIMFAVDLDTKLKQSGSKVLSVAAHPGYTATNLQQHMGLLGVVMNKLLAQKVEMGILPTLRAAVDSDLTGGEYMGPLKFDGYRGYPELNKLPIKAQQSKVRDQLWKISEALIGTEFRLH